MNTTTKFTSIDQQVLYNSTLASILYPVLPSGERARPVGERFIVVYENGAVHAMTAERVGWLFDMADTIECGFKVEWVHPAGATYPVKVGEQEMNEGDGENAPVVYASAPLLAGDDVIGWTEVGRVDFTDH